MAHNMDHRAMAYKDRESEKKMIRLDFGLIMDDVSVCVNV